MVAPICGVVAGGAAYDPRRRAPAPRPRAHPVCAVLHAHLRSVQNDMVAGRSEGEDAAMGFCSGCGERLPDGARFCPGCGTAVAGDRRREAPAERRTVTVLFADAVGSTAFAERAGDEATYRLVEAGSAVMGGGVEG